VNYFDWESLFLQTDPKTQRERFEKMGLSEDEIVSRMTKILEAETLIPPLAMPGVGVGGGGKSPQGGQTDPSENEYVVNDYIDDYFV